MQPPWLLWLPWLLVVAGGGLGAPYVLRMMRATLSAPAFTAVVHKLLAAGDADRVVKLCRAAGDVPLAAATRAAVLACARGVAQGDPSADYRRAVDVSPERVLAPVRAAYDQAFEAVARPLHYARCVAIPGAFMLVAALSLAGGVRPPSLAPTIVAGVGLALLGWAGRSERGVMASRDATFEALRGVLDALVRAPGTGLSDAAGGRGGRRGSRPA